MAPPEMWKLLHLLNVHGSQLSRQTIRSMHITCDPDTIGPLVMAGQRRVRTGLESIMSSDRCGKL
jgi:hypothetical protein